ncbi:uncharacterized protein LOC117569276 [Drosophila albomicans]|uniref:Uncharacterized protein LOC117569276 n=1 Tax=Drosophila albomicans TaxID=7291 RepID=A0A9C6WE08_DROAB|nr:uncharacterized protein LOC117569276 [Drosophila albomicans]
MASNVVVLLLLGLTLKGGETSSIDSNDSEVLGIRKDQIVCPSNTTAGSPRNLAGIIRFIVKDDVERYKLVLNMARNQRTSTIKNEIVEAISMDFETYVTDPIKILDFCNAITYMDDISQEKFYQALVNRSARILVDLILANNSCTESPIDSELPNNLHLIPIKYLEKILEAVFDIVLSSESPLKVADCLYNITDSFEQGTIANLLLLNRAEVKTNSSEHAGLLANLQKFLNLKNFKYVDVYWRRRVYRLFPHHIDWLSTTSNVCIRHANNKRDNLVHCYEGDTRTMCTSEYPCPNRSIYYHVFKKRSVIAIGYKHIHGSIAMNATKEKGTRRPNVSKNLFRSKEIFFWHVVPVLNGLALYDSETSESVLCGGDPAQWVDNKHFAYTRRAEDFDAHREECTWYFEDCNYE